MFDRIICSFSLFVVVAQVVTTLLLAAAIPDVAQNDRLDSLENAAATPASETAQVTWQPSDIMIDLSEDGSRYLLFE